MGLLIHGRRKTKHRLVVLLISQLAWLMVFPPQIVLALPKGARVVSGGATFIHPNSRTLEVRTSNKVIINYKDFSIGRKELVRFIQPSSSSLALNRVVGENPSKILGRLLANGRIFLINPNGVLFGKNARVNARSFLASTLDIANEDFLNGRYVFRNKPGYKPSFIINQGTIEAGPGGYIALAAPSVLNTGTLKAPGGKVILGGVSGFTLDPGAGGLLDFFVPSSDLPQGDVVLSGILKNRLLKGLVNMADEEVATGIEVGSNGEVRLVGGSVTNEGFIGANGQASSQGSLKDGGQILLTSARKTYLVPETRISANGVGEGASGGEIRILSRGDTYVNGASITARGGPGGQGGFVELSADGTLDLSGLSVDTGAPWGARGEVLFDPEEITISNDVYSHGSDLNYQADKSITLENGVMISTRDVSGETHSDQLNGTSLGDSGNITMEAPQITIGDGSYLLSFANNGYTGGDITLKAHDSQSSHINAEAGASINVGEGAYLKGKNITLDAQADATADFNFLDDPIDYYLPLHSEFSILTPAGVAVSDATSEIDVGKNAYIEGDGDVSLTSSATTTSKVNLISDNDKVKALGVVIGITEPHSSVNIGQGVTLKSGGNLKLDSQADATMDVQDFSIDLGEGRGSSWDFTLAFGETDSKASTQVAQGAHLQAGGNIDLNSQVIRSAQVLSFGGAYEDGTLGLSVAVSRFQDEAEAFLGGSAEANGDISIGTNLEVKKGRTEAISEGEKSWEQKYWYPGANDVKAALNMLLTKVLLAPDERSQAQSVDLGVSAAFTYAQHDESSVASVGSGARVNTRGKLSIDSSIEYDEGSIDGLQTAAGASIKCTDSSKKDFAVAGAISVAEVSNEARAYLDSGAVVNASKDITINSKVDIPYDVEWLEIKGPRDIADKLKPDLGIKRGFFTTWAQAASKGDVVGVAGMVNYFSLDNTVDSHIGENCSVNQDPGYRTGQQTVSLSSSSNVETANFEGVIELIGSPPVNKTGVGGSYMQVEYGNFVSSEVRPGANIYADSFNMEAESQEKNISLSISGQKADKFALNATFSLLKSNTESITRVDSGAKITVGNAGDMSLNSHDYAQLYNLSGDIVRSKNYGVGVSVSINEIGRDVEALFEGEGNSAGKLSLSSKGDGQISAWSLAGTINTDLRAYSSTYDPLDGISLPSLFGDVKSGLSIAGDASYNNVTGAVEAGLSHANLSQVGVISISANNTGSIDSVAGAAALGGGQKSSGLAGSCTINIVDVDTLAFCKNSTLSSSGSVDLNAQSSGSIYSLAAGGSLAPPKTQGFSGSLAGSVTYNKISNETRAYVEGSTVNSGALCLTSQDSSKIYSLAGAVDFGGNTLGVGLGVGINHLGSTTESYLSDSFVDVDGEICVAASTHGDIKTGSVAAGDVPEGVVIDGSLTFNTVKNTTRARIEGGSDSSRYTGGGDVKLSSRDDSSILAVAGGIDGAGNSSVGVSAVYNDLGNVVSTSVQDANLESRRGSLVLESHSTPHITVVAAEASGSRNFSMAGSVVINHVHDEVDSYITGSTIDVYNTLVCLAQQKNTEEVYAGALAVSGSLEGVGVEGTASVNVNENKTSSYVAGSQLQVRGNQSYEIPKADGSGDTEDYSGLAVEALSENDFKLYTANISGSALGALTGVASVNIFNDDTQAYIGDNTSVNSDLSQIAQGQGIKVAAYSGISSSVAAGDAALGGGEGVGAVCDVSILKGKTKAYIQGSEVKARGDIGVTSTTREREDSIVVGAAASCGGDVAGSVAVAISSISNESYIEDSTITSREGNLTVGATDNVDFGEWGSGKETGIIAGAVAIGGVDGLGGSLIYSHISNETKAHITGSTTNAWGTTEVEANSSQRVRTYSITGNLGSFDGVAGAVCVNTVGVTTEAYIDGGSQVNQDSSYSNQNQKVEVKAKNSTSIKSTPGGGDLSIEGALGGSVDYEGIRNTVKAYLGDNVEVSAGGDVEVSAQSQEEVDPLVIAIVASGTVAIEGSVSLVFVGSAITDDGVKAAKSSRETMNINISGSKVGDMLGDNEIGQQAKSEADGETSQISVDKDFDTGSTFNHTTSAFIGKDAVVKADGNINVNSQDNLNLDDKVGGLSVSSIGIGGSVAVGYLKPDALAYVVEGAVLDAGGDVSVSASSREDATVESYVGSSGLLVALGAGVAYLDSENKAEAYLGDGVQVKKADSVNIEASMDSQISTKADGIEVGGAIAGGCYARSGEKGGAWAFLGKGVEVGNQGDTVGSLSVKAKADSQLSSNVSGSSGGVVKDFNYNQATVSNAPTAKAYISSLSEVNVKRDVGVLALAQGSSSASTHGVNVSGETHIGLSRAYASWSPQVSAYIGSNSEVKAGGSVSVIAYNNYDENGVELTGNTVEADSDPSLTGSLLGSGDSSKSEVEINAQVSSTIRSGATINAGRDINVVARSFNNGIVKATGRSGSLVAVGTTRALANISNSTVVSIGNNAKLSSGYDDIYLTAFSHNEATLGTHDHPIIGGKGGLIAKGGVDVEGTIDNHTGVEVGEGASLSAKWGELVISALTTGMVVGNAELETLGGVTENEVNVKSIIDSDTYVLIDRDVQIDADKVRMEAIGAYDSGNGVGLYAHAYAYSKTIDGDTTSTARATASVTSKSRVHLADGVDVNAPNGVYLEALENKVQTYSFSYATIKAGITGTLNSYATSDLNSNAVVETDPGSKIETSYLLVKSSSPSDKGWYHKLAKSSSNTVVKWVLKVVGKVCHWVEKIIDWLIHHKTHFCKPIEKWIEKVLHGTTNDHTYGKEVRNETINFNSDVTLLGKTLDQWLHVDSQGNVKASKKVKYEVLPDRIVVDDVLPPERGKAELYATNGVIMGKATFRVHGSYQKVDITNDSSKDLEIKSVQVFDRKWKEGDVEYEARDPRSFDYELIDDLEETKVSINNNSDSNIYINGDIYNPGGTTNIYNKGGNILTEEPAQSLMETRILSLNAPEGSLGQEDYYLNARLVHTLDWPTYIDFYSGKDAYLNLGNPILVSEPGAFFTTIDSGFTGGDLHLKMGQGYYERWQYVYGNDSSQVLDDPVDSILYLRRINSVGDITIEAHPSVTLNVEGIVSSGLGDIEGVLASPGGELTGNLLYYSYTENQSGNDIGLGFNINKGGNITLTGGNLVGTGEILALEGYPRVTIVNETDKNLLLQNTEISHFKGSVTFNGNTLDLSSYYNGIAVDRLGYDQGTLDVENKGSGSLHLAEDNTLGDINVYLKAPDGDIIQEGGHSFATQGLLSIVASGDFRQEDNASLSAGSVQVTASNAKFEALESQGDVDVKASGTIGVEGDLVSHGGIGLDAGSSISIGKDVVVEAEGAIKVVSGGEINMDSGSIMSSGGSMNLEGDGNLSLGRLESTTGISILSHNGAVVSNGSVNSEFVSPELYIQAQGGVGSVDGQEKPLTTQVGKIGIENLGSGEVLINNKGSVTLTNMGGGDYAIYNAGDKIQITASELGSGDEGNLVVQGAVKSAQGDVILSSSSGDLRVESNISPGEGRNIELNASRGRVEQTGGMIGEEGKNQNLIVLAARGIDLLYASVASFNAYNSGQGDIHILNMDSDLYLQDLGSGQGYSVNNPGGGISIVNAGGSIRIHDPVKASGTVRFETNGSLESDIQGVAISADGLSIESQGGVGSLGELGVEVNKLEILSAGGTINVKGYTTMSLEDFDTDLGVNGASIVSGGGDVVITTQAGDLDIRNDLVSSSALTLKAIHGNIIQHSGTQIVSGEDLTMVSGKSIQQEQGALIDSGTQALSGSRAYLEAGDDLVLNDVISGKSIILKAGKSILETGDADVDLESSELVMEAGLGIGSGDPLETKVYFLDASAGSGDVWVKNTGGLCIKDLNGDQFGIVSNGGKIDVETLEDLEVSSNVKAATDLRFVSGGDIVQRGSNISAGGDVEMVSSGGEILMDRDSLIESTGGNVDCQANGDIFVGRIKASTTNGIVSLTSQEGAIMDSRISEGFNVESRDLILKASKGIGSAAMVVKVKRLQAENTDSGIIQLLNTGDLDIVQLSPAIGGGILNQGDEIRVSVIADDSTPGNMTVDSDVISDHGDVYLCATGEVSLHAQVEAGPGKRVVINSGRRCNRIRIRSSPSRSRPRKNRRR